MNQFFLTLFTRKLQAPSLSVQSKVIYIGSGILADSYQGNLEKSVDTFLNSGDTVILTDRSVLGEIPVYLEMHWEEGKFWVPSEEQ